MTSCLACAFEAAPELESCPQCGASLVDPLLGAVLGDRYRIDTRIGVGGMGAVYRAFHTTLKRDVAIKVLLPDFGGKEEFVRRFQREAESASRLAHPNIIAVTDFGRTPENLLFLVMEFLDGRSLTSVIRQGPLGLARALAIVRQILAALSHAHVAGIVHRDLKPDNIMLLERDGRADVVKILDFGIAKITDAAGGREALTQAGMIFGTPEYLSPEQALGDAVDARADLYAAGVILFEMLTGRRPFESDDKVRIISMHLSHPVPRMADVNPAAAIAVAVPIEEVVMQALEKPREHRFASAAAFLAALEDAELALTFTPAITVAAASSGSGTAAASWESGTAAASWESGTAAASWESGTAAASSESRTAAASFGSGTAWASSESRTAAASSGSGTAAASSGSGTAWVSSGSGTAAVSSGSGTPSASPGSGSLGSDSLGFDPGARGPAVFGRLRGPQQARWIVAGIVVVALLISGIAIFSGRSSRSKTVATGKVTQPGPMSPELAAKIRIIEGLLGSGEIVRARVALEQVLTEHPGNARVRYLLGRLAFAEDHYTEALGNYREAIALDPGFRGDPILIEHLGAAVGEPKVADAALDLAIERVGRPAVDLLERVANGAGDLRRRQRAARALGELNEGRRVDQVALRIAELRKAGTCEERKPLVITLGKAEDTRALPALRAQRSRGGLERLFGADPNNACMKAELADAIARLEAKLPPDKRPSTSESTSTTSRSSVRQSASRFFRGR